MNDAPLVYIAHPLRGDWLANLERARHFASLALQAGYAPIAPYLMGLPLDDAIAEERQIGLEWDHAVVIRCDELWACGPEISEGVRTEMGWADEAGLVVRRFPTLGSASTYLANRAVLRT